MNPLKCFFGVSSGKFLGFIVRKAGIELDPIKVKAILEMPSPRTLRELKGFKEDWHTSDGSFPTYQGSAVHSLA